MGSAVFKHSQKGRCCRFAHLAWPGLFCNQDLQLNSVQIGASDSFAWQKVRNLQCQCSMEVGKFKVLDLLDSAVLEHGQVGSCRFEHLAVARSALLSRPAVRTRADW